MEGAWKQIRGILFRGKREDNGEWVEGFYVCLGKEYHYILTGKLNLTKGYPEFEKYKVISETVGQYIGLTDKNGEKIFKGDIVKQYFECQENEYDYSTFDIGRVFWYQHQTRFLRTSKLFPDDCHKMLEHYEYEVIGNIYDNPELLCEK